MSLEEEAKKFLQQRNQGNEPDKLREELIKMYPIVFEMCAEHGYNMTGRDHIIAYDTKRGV